MSLQESASYDPKHLISGHFPLLSESATLITGQNLTRGAVLGKITAGAVPAVGTAGGGNTGGGTMTGVAGGVKVKAGVYTATCITLVANGGVFAVTDPDGLGLGAAIAGVEFSHPQIVFTIADSGTDFAIGDSFTVTVPAGSGKVTLSLAAAIDGSAEPWGVLAEDGDATDADIAVPVYLAGVFNPEAGVMTFGTGHTAATVAAAWANRPLFLREPE